MFRAEAVIAVVASSLICARSAFAGPPAPSSPETGSSAELRVESDAVPAAPLNPYVPPACTGVFTDVACPGGFAVNWIEKFYADGITAGCNAAPLEYCPDSTVTRAQMAVFVEKAMRGTGTWSPGDLGSGNPGLGANALLNNTYGGENTAIGLGALYTQSFTNGNSPYLSYNTAVGAFSLNSNQPDGGNGGSDGTYNAAVGLSSLGGNTTGYLNTAIGSGAGSVNSIGSLDTFLGGFANPISSGLVDATAIGYNAVVDASYHVQVGDTQVTQIGGQVAWSNLSDARAKNDIRDLGLGLDFVLALRPVSFTMKSGNGRTDMGFVAQDVEALLGDEYNVLGIGGDKDRTLSLRYTDPIAPMVKAIQEQQATIAAQQSKIESQAAQIEILKAQQGRSAQQQTAFDALLARVAKLEAAGVPLQGRLQ